MIKIYSLLLILIFILVIGQQNLYAQTTGKIAGMVYDENNGEPAAGANVLVEGTNLGASVDLDGSFFILNVPPGSYTVIVEMIGYKSYKVEQLRVSVNRTAIVEAKLEQTILEGEVIVVQADELASKKDQTSSIRNISSKQMDILPVESIADVVNMQPGVVLGHFRGGRRNEVAYLIDGIQVDEAYGRNGKTVNIEKDAVEEVEVITGIFSAKYGNAMSGVVNVVTKDGGNEFHGSVSGQYANFVTSNKDIFIGLDDLEWDRQKDYKISLNGPIISNRINFAVNVRYVDTKGHLNGINRFLPNDYSNFMASDSAKWYSEHNGDNSYVPLSWGKHLNIWGKLSFRPLNNLKLSLQYIQNDDESQGYSHFYKYKPYGRAVNYHQSHLLSFQANHTLSLSAFQELKVSYINNYTGNYVYENPLDERYVHDQYGQSAGGFATGGQHKGHTERRQIDLSVKWDFYWQAHKNHNLGGGLTFIQRDLDNRIKQIRNSYYASEWEHVFVYDSLNNKRNYIYYEPVTLPDSTLYSEIYQVKPIEFSFYLEDKMEFEEMVINLGLRFDYFDPSITYPSQWRNPSNQLRFNNNPEKMSVQKKADPKYQISPRLGISYQLGETALLRFGYGHFLQMPPLYAMYANHARKIPPQNYSTTLGNPQIKAQKTIQYEIGFWQRLTNNMSLEVALFYRDIYDLQSAKIITTYNQIRYGLYSNKDYANARGLEVKYDFILGNLSTYLNYTLQYSRGNADNPTSTFNRAGSNTDPVNKLIPMSWDQRHTFNATVGYNTGGFGATLSLYYNSGTAYTWAPIVESTLSRINLFPNNSHILSAMNMDLKSYYDLMSFSGMNFRFTLLVYNLLDQLNDVAVNATTGRAYTAIIRDIDKAAHRSDFNDVYDRIHNPAMFSAPRLVKLGLEVSF